jgi:hypothetical protein
MIVKRVSDYSILEKLGGHGVVQEGADACLGRQVALESLPKE